MSVFEIEVVIERKHVRDRRIIEEHATIPGCVWVSVQLAEEPVPSGHGYVLQEAGPLPRLCWSHRHNTRSAQRIPQTRCDKTITRFHENT